MERSPVRPNYLFRRNTTTSLRKQGTKDDYHPAKMKRQLSVIKEGLRPVMSDPSSLSSR